jgi:peptide/nickel transport system permease protein
MVLFTKDIKKLFRRKTTTIGIIFFIVLGIAAIIGPLLSPYSSTDMTSNFLKSPTASNWFGTDDFGRDVMTRTLFGIRTSLIIGLITALGSGYLGTIIGLIAGFFNKADFFLMRLMDIIMSFPSMLLALGILVAFGRSTINILIALSIVYTPTIARVVRGSTLSVREEDYIEAARAIGLPWWRILIHHVLPNVFVPLIVQATFVFAYGMLSEAGLGFIGVGIQPPTPSLGNILADARSYIREGPWMTFFPGGVLFILVISINFIGDGLREFMDPRVVEH